MGPITPEAQEGRPIALVQTGDRITLDAGEKLLLVDLTEVELAERRGRWTMPPHQSTRWTLAKYSRLVKIAGLGCVTDE